MKTSELLSGTLDRIGPLDESAMAGARERQDRLTKPNGSLGRLEEFSIRLAGIQVPSAHYRGAAPANTDLAAGLGRASGAWGRMRGCGTQRH